jgi:hypothetical protein
LEDDVAEDAVTVVRKVGTMRKMMDDNFIIKKSTLFQQLPGVLIKFLLRHQEQHT